MHLVHTLDLLHFVRVNNEVYFVFPPYTPLIDSYRVINMQLASARLKECISTLMVQGFILGGRVYFKVFVLKASLNAATDQLPLAHTVDALHGALLLRSVIVA